MINFIFLNVKNISWQNIKELHLANLKKTEKDTLVAQKLNDGLLNYQEILSYLPNEAFITFEILGGISTFESQIDVFSNLKREVIV